MMHRVKQLTKKAQRGAVTREFIPFVGLIIGLVILASILLAKN
jgi:hypothetical protein